MKLEFEFDKEKLFAGIKNATDLDNDNSVFEALALLADIKKQFNDVYDEVSKLDTEVKQAINDRAKAVIGVDWQAIAGDKYKITKSKAGAVYEINGKPKDDFVTVKFSVNTKAVDNEFQSTGKLPSGIAVNEHRSESIRVTLK